MMTQMTQTAPYPDILAGLVSRLQYRQHLGWEVQLADDLQRDKPGRHTGESRGLTLVVTRCGPDTHHHPPNPDVVENALIAVSETPGQAELRALVDAVRAERRVMIRVEHYFPVPPATYNLASWQRWLFDRLGDVDTHERMEDFAVADSPGAEHVVRPYAPNHGPGQDPYRVCEVTTDEARRTSFRGDVNPT